MNAFRARLGLVLLFAVLLGSLSLWALPQAWATPAQQRQCAVRGTVPVMGEYCLYLPISPK